MTDSGPRDVWVSSADRHTPAHRIPTGHIPAADAPDGGTAFVIACPPRMTFGGVAITRAQARILEVHPCARCFGIKQAYPPPPSTADPAAAQPDRAPDLSR